MKVHYKEKKRIKFRISFIFLFIIASFAICFVMYMNSDENIEDKFSFDFLNKFKKDEIIAEPVINEVDINETVQIINPIKRSEEAPISYYNDTLFITGLELKGLTDYNFVPKDNFIVDDTLSVIAYENSEIISKINDAKPKAVYFHLPLNEVTTFEDDTYFNKYSNLFDEIRQSNDDIIIYVMSLIPITADCEAELIDNIKIDAYNTALLSFAKEKNICYIDINTQFKGNDGKLPSAMAETKNTRLKKDAYEELSNYILTHIYDGE